MQGDLKDNFICPEYRQLPGSKVCQHYAGNRSCSLETGILCVEWLRRNPGHYDEGTTELMLDMVRSLKKPVRDVPSGSSSQTSTSAPHRRATVPAGGPQVSAALGLAVDGRELASPSVADVERLAALGYELTLETDAGELTLVPKYTSQDRVELSFADSRTLAAIASIFPGSKLRRLRRQIK